MTPDSLEPEVSTEVQDPASAAVTSWDDVSPQLTETREMEIPRPTEPLDEQRPAEAVAPPTKPLSGLTAQSISAWFGDHKVLDRVSLTMDAGHGHRADRTIRLRQIHLPADPEPDARDDPRRSAGRPGSAR